MLNSRYLQERFWLLAIGTPKSGDVQRCPKMSKDVQLSWSQALQIVPHLPPTTLHPFIISTNILVAKLRVAGISNFVHISDTSTEYILTVNV